MAASGANVKVGVSGVAQFKQAISQAKTSIKTLDAQLALTEKQFKANGDAEEYLQKKTEQLQSKMEAQKTVIENTEKALNDMRTRGVDMNSKAFQDMVQQLTRANSDLLDTQMQMQGVEAAADDTASAVSDMSDDLSNIGSQVSFQTVTDGLGKITDGLQNIVKKAFDAGKALFMMTLGSAGWADELNEAAQKAGMSTKEYQQMAAAAQLVDTSIDSVISGQQKLAQASEKDNDDMNQIFARLGVQTKRYGEVRDLNDLFWETGEALMKIDNAADKADMGKKLFGQWRELVPMFEMGREEYEKLRDSQSYVDEEHLKNLTELDDSYRGMQHEIDVLKNDFFAELAPSIKTVTDALSGLVKEFNAYLKTKEGKEMMKSLSDNIKQLFDSITKFDPEDAIKKISDVMGGIQSGFQWIADNWEGVKVGLLAIAGGWAAIKVATLGLNIGKLVSGFQGLFGGGNGNNGNVGKGTGAATGSGAGTAGGASAFSVGLTTAATKAANFLGVGGMPLAVGADIFLNQTNAGRALRDGGDVWEGLNKDITEKQEEISKNASTFVDDWVGVLDNITFATQDLFGIGGGGGAERSFGEPEEPDNSATQDLLDMTGGGGAERSFGDAMDDLEASTDKMNQTAEEMSDGTNVQKHAGTDMSNAARILQVMPSQVESAIISGMSQIKIYIDGQQAGSAVAPYVDSAMGGVLAMVRR